MTTAWGKDSSSQFDAVFLKELVLEGGREDRHCFRPHGIERDYRMGKPCSHSLIKRGVVLRPDFEMVPRSSM